MTPCVGSIWMVRARSLSSHLFGDNARAASERTSAVALLKGGPSKFFKVADLLAGAKAPPLEEVLDVSIRPQQKAIVLAALAQTFPDAPNEFLSQARRLNVSLSFPLHLVAQAIEALEKSR